ncbi:aminotransferase class V-fold PLP-dependent enzyme [Mycolicibacterium sp. YH-1]|uniref:aminotransferase class V-fold PLP-dependent enzyme n=1 Tax=Mycolicibacterium sp. YH-1 TaxID=2908837 RepID=UPI001F4C301B|nr:aminotransferase class V-fold PLP-dependent enzyme [Mycolicibacterium sp. YH-1]UNB51493.1 aminotransferase class V-fold PLP-dependent enzyme [Mycolicibacterium sp. YH-1]
MSSNSVGESVTTLRNPPTHDRKDFPSLHRLGADGERFVHADAPGGTQVTQGVIDAIGAFLGDFNSNPTRDFVTSLESRALVDSTRQGVGELLDADAEGVIFGPNMTSLTWHFARAFEKTLQPGDNIVCTQLDHDANVAPWLAISERRGAEVRFVRLDPESFTLRYEDLDRVVDSRTRLIAFSRTSNLIGTEIDTAPFVGAAQAVGALTFADGVAAAAHTSIAQTRLGIDVSVCSAYKFFGPHIGVLSASPAVLERFEPDKVRPAPAAGPRRWELGMPTLESIAGLSAAADYMLEIGYERIRAHERTLTGRTLEALAGLDHITLHGIDTIDGREPIFAVTVAGWTPRAVARELAKHGVFVSSGNNYAIECLRALGISDVEGVVRFGFVYYHDDEDVDRLTAALAALRR